MHNTCCSYCRRRRALYVRSLSLSARLSLTNNAISRASGNTGNGSNSLPPSLTWEVSRPRRYCYRQKNPYFIFLGKILPRSTPAVKTHGPHLIHIFCSPKKWRSVDGGTRAVCVYHAQNPWGQFCRRGKYEEICLPPAASLLDGPVSRNLQLFLCDKIAPGFWAWLQRSETAN